MKACVGRRGFSGGPAAPSARRPFAFVALLPAALGLLQCGAGGELASEQGAQQPQARLRAAAEGALRRLESPQALQDPLNRRLAIGLQAVAEAAPQHPFAQAEGAIPSPSGPLSVCVDRSCAELPAGSRLVSAALPSATVPAPRRALSLRFEPAKLLDRQILEAHARSPSLPAFLLRLSPRLFLDGRPLSLTPLPPPVALGVPVQVALSGGPVPDGPRFRWTVTAGARWVLDLGPGSPTPVDLGRAHRRLLDGARDGDERLDALLYARATRHHYATHELLARLSRHLPTTLQSSTPPAAAGIGFTVEWLQGVPLSARAMGPGADHLMSASLCGVAEPRALERWAAETSAGLVLAPMWVDRLMR